MNYYIFVHLALLNEYCIHSSHAIHLMLVVTNIYIYGNVIFEY